VTGHSRKAISVAASNQSTWRGSNPWPQIPFALNCAGLLLGANWETTPKHRSHDVLFQTAEKLAVITLS
jgi:hypothetical protein